jgi:hypothetical protein
MRTKREPCVDYDEWIEGYNDNGRDMCERDKEKGRELPRGDCWYCATM